MMPNSNIRDNIIQLYCQGFSKLNRKGRIDRLHRMGLLSESDINLLHQSVDSDLISISEKLVENVIGCFPMPLGVATNFKIDGKRYIIPMVVEETSIIAAVSRTARWISQCGELSTSQSGQNIIGQIHMTHVVNFDEFERVVNQHKDKLIFKVNQQAVPNLLRRGGGVKDLQVRQMTCSDAYPVERKEMAVIHVLLDPCEAMGANAVTQACEYLKKPLQELTHAIPKMAIVSNLADTRLTHARVVMHQIDPALAKSIEEASYFAQHDPYRAATHNKGVLNGIDGVLIATGNDWRAVEAGIHAYAAQQGQYGPITRWYCANQKLIGEFEAPVIVGTVGGVTTLHPFAQLCLRIMGVKTAEHLSRLIGAVGLVQNLGALRALTTTGIVQGHMKLHINNLLLGVGAKAHEMTPLRAILEKQLKRTNKISLSDAQAALRNIRNSIVELLKTDGSDSHSKSKLSSKKMEFTGGK